MSQSWILNEVLCVLASVRFYQCKPLLVYCLDNECNANITDSNTRLCKVWSPLSFFLVGKKKVRNRIQTSSSEHSRWFSQAHYLLQPRAKPLIELKQEDMKLDPRKLKMAWKKATCPKGFMPRSYEVMLKGKRYRRNRKDLIKTQGSWNKTSPRSHL